MNMSNVRQTVRGKEACLRKQLLTRIFLQTLSHEDDGFYNKPCAYETPSRKTVQLPGEQFTVPEIEEQNVMRANVQNEILQENGNKPCSEPIKMKLTRSWENDVVSDMKYNGNELKFASACNTMDFQDSSNSAVITQSNAEKGAELIRKCYAPKRLKKSESKALKKYSKILNLIEGLERRITEFCNKENNTPIDASTSVNVYDIPRLQNIKSSGQKEKYEKYQSKTSKACKQLEAEIFLYSQYIETLETAINSIPEGTEIYKVLQAKVKKAYKFHLESPLHKEAKELDRQCKLVGLLLKRFPGQNNNL